MYCLRKLVYALVFDSFVAKFFSRLYLGGLLRSINAMPVITLYCIMKPIRNNNRMVN